LLSTAIAAEGLGILFFGSPEISVPALKYFQQSIISTKSSSLVFEQKRGISRWT
jgi:hypothetical protein